MIQCLNQFNSAFTLIINAWIYITSVYFWIAKIGFVILRRVLQKMIFDKVFTCKRILIVTNQP